MKKILLVMSMILLLNIGIGIVSAHEHNFAETKQLIDSGISCDKLTNKQLEAIGEYYMEQMHPGESHELMDKMMGGDDSESLNQMHIRMAKVLYCGESGGMMGSEDMIGMMSMMNGKSGMMQGMMSISSYSGYWNFVNVLYIILLIGVIILVYIWIVKL